MINKKNKVMNKIFLVIVIFIASVANSQIKKDHDKDTILYYFKKFQPFEAQEKIRSAINIYNLDYKTLRKDKEIKSYLLKCLDQKLYFETLIKDDINEFLIYLDDPNNFKEELIIYLYETKKNKQIDSILNLPDLKLKYKDSIISKREILYRKGKDFHNYYPPIKILVLMRYPEVYNTVKEWSKKAENNYFLEELLYFNDPDAKKEYDRIMEGVLKDTPANFGGYIFNVETAYTFKAAYKLLEVDKKVEFVSRGEYETADIGSFYNCVFANNLIEIFERYNIKISNEILMKKTQHWSNSKSDIDICALYKKFRPEIKIHISEVIKIREKEEEDWMKNMPFYKRH